MATSQSVDVRRMALPTDMQHIKATSLIRRSSLCTSVPTAGEKAETA